jgi:hypothetical protein
MHEGTQYLRVKQINRFLIAAVIVATLVTSYYPNQWSFIVLGLLVVGLSGNVLFHRKLIMHEYEQGYDPSTNRALRKLTEPVKWVYNVNVYVLWPIIMLLGLLIIYYAIF